MIVKFENMTIQNCVYTVSLVVPLSQAIFNNITFFQNSYCIWAIESLSIIITDSYISHSKTAIHLDGSILHISSSQINDGETAIYAYGNSSVMAENCSFLRNTAESGASVYYYTSSLFFNSCCFECNVALDFGGVMALMQGTTGDFHNCNFTNNT